MERAEGLMLYGTVLMPNGCMADDCTDDANGNIDDADVHVW